MRKSERPTWNAIAHRTHIGLQENCLYGRLHKAKMVPYPSYPTGVTRYEDIDQYEASIVVYFMRLLFISENQWAETELFIGFEDGPLPQTGLTPEEYALIKAFAVDGELPPKTDESESE